MAICKQLSNLGASQCGFPMTVARRLVFVPKYNSAGEPNRILVSELKLLSLWKDAIEAQEDPRDRFYILPNMENVEDVRADSEFFEWESGQKVRIRQGVRTFTGAIPNETPMLLGELQAWQGQQFGVYVFDTAGSLIFNYKAVEESAGVWKDYAYPIYVDGNSLDAKYMKATYTDPLHIMLQFDYAQDVNDKDLWLVPMGGEGLQFDGRVDLKPLMTVHGMTLEAVVGSITVALKLDYTVPAAGFEAKDFTVYDSDGAVKDTVDSGYALTENPDGTYKVIDGTSTIVAGDSLGLTAAGYLPYRSTKVA